MKTRNANRNVIRELLDDEAQLWEPKAEDETNNLLIVEMKARENNWHEDVKMESFDYHSMAKTMDLFRSKNDRWVGRRD
eukprot:scaffold277917_cov48-Attheya_sp.AAC.3